MRYSLFFLLLFCFGVSLPAQIRQGLYGTVSDENGDVLIGANVTVKRNSAVVTSITSDFDGLFQVALDTGRYQVSITYTGYEAYLNEDVKIKAGQLRKLDVVMSDGGQLEEVIVTGYATRNKRAKRGDDSRANYEVADVVGPGIAADQAQGRISYMRSSAPVMPGGSVPAPARQTYSEATSVANGEDYRSLRKNAFTLPQNEPLSTFGADVDVAAYANVRRFLNQGQLPPTDAVRTEELINYFNYDYPAPKGNDPVAFTTELGACPWNAKHQLLHIGLQARELEVANLPASNLVFLIDVSGSMNNPDKLPLLKEGFRMLVQQLRPQDKVAIVVYASAAGTVLAPTSGAAKDTILAALDQISAGGSTAGGAGLKLAYKLAEEHLITGGNNRIVLATDGDFNVGTTDNSSLEDYVDGKRRSGIFLSVLGFGQGNYQDARMQTIAESGNGNAAYIDNLLEARKVLVEEFGGTLYTVAKDVKLQVEFNPSRVGAYRLIGYESRLLNPEDFNDDTKDAGDMGSAHTVTALYEIIPAGVESSFLPSIEPLKYQESSIVRDGLALSGSNQDVATVRMKYKQPDAEKSEAKVEVPVGGAAETLANTSERFRWSAAMAGWSLLLRNSDYLGTDFGYAELLPLAEGARTQDDKGYRAEAVRLMQAARDLTPKRELQAVAGDR